MQATIKKILPEIKDRRKKATAVKQIVQDHAAALLPVLLSTNLITPGLYRVQYPLSRRLN